MAEKFIFFSIKNVSEFKLSLAKYVPTSSYDVTQILAAIDQAKQTARTAGTAVKHVDATLSQITFSRAGLNALGVKELTRDTRFDKGPMKLDRADLGDQGKWVDTFEAGSVHGMFVVATSSKF